MEKTKDELITKICELYQSGLSIPKISKELRLSSFTIHKYIKQNNLTRSLEDAHNLRSKQMINYDYFDIINTEEKSYWLGLLWSDGAIIDDPRNYQIRLGLQKDDYYLVQLFGQIFGHNARIYNNMCRAEIRNKHLYYSILDKGIFTHRAEFELFTTPNFVPKEHIRHFIRGILDGDGSIYRFKDTQLRLSFTNNYNCLKWISDVISCTLGISNRKITVKSNCFEIQYHTHDCIKILDWLYLDTLLYLVRKKNIFDDYKEYRLAKYGTIYKKEGGLSNA